MTGQWMRLLSDNHLKDVDIRLPGNVDWRGLKVGLGQQEQRDTALGTEQEPGQDSEVGLSFVPHRVSIVGCGSMHGRGLLASDQPTYLFRM